MVQATVPRFSPRRVQVKRGQPSSQLDQLLSQVAFACLLEACDWGGVNRGKAKDDGFWLPRVRSRRTCPSMVHLPN